VAPTSSTQWQLDRSTFDRAASPCNDFYQYVCGGFDNPAHVAPDQASADWARDLARVANDRAIQQLLTGSDGSDPELERLRTFYASCMASSDATGGATLARWLQRIDGIKRPADVTTVVRELQLIGVNALFQFSGQPDATDPSLHRGELDTGAFGASLRVYTDKSAGADDRREAYRDHIPRCSRRRRRSRRRGPTRATCSSSRRRSRPRWWPTSTPASASTR
jgi:predicted metalloendopeptidase